MGFKPEQGKAFADLASDLEAFSLVIEDRAAIARDVVEPTMRQQARRNLASAGRYGGGNWNFAGEERYRRQKAAWVGAAYADLPLVMPPDKAKLAPSLTDPADPNYLAVVTESGIQMGSRLEYANRLFVTGGIGPRGEYFPARDPYIMTESQQIDMAREIELYVLEKWRARE